MTLNKFENVKIKRDPKTGKEKSRSYRFTMCSLRRSFMTAGAQAGLTHFRLLKLSGHTDIKTADKYIQQHREEQERKAASAMLQQFLRNGSKAMSSKDVVTRNGSMNSITSEQSLLSQTQSIDNRNTTNTTLPRFSQQQQFHNINISSQNSYLDRHARSIASSQSQIIVNLTQHSQVQEFESIPDSIDSLYSLFGESKMRQNDWSSQTKNKAYKPAVPVRPKPLTMSLRS